VLRTGIGARDTTSAIQGVLGIAVVNITKLMAMHITNVFICLVIRQPALGSVRKHFWNFTCSDLALNGAPEIGSKNLVVMFE
jgi:hypothetical protein